MLQVVTPADDLNILSIEELRIAVGLQQDDGSRDSDLASLGPRVSSMIVAACGVVSDGEHQPTLMREGLVETIRITSNAATLTLSRRPIGDVTSMSENGVLLAEDVDFEVDQASGRILRINNDRPSCWAVGKIVVEYDAGFDVAPDGLKAITAQLASGYWAESGDDPLERSVSIPGVIDVQRWVDASANSQMPQDIYAALVDAGYVNRNLVL